MSLDISLDIEVDTGHKVRTFRVFEANITHNCGRMANEAAIYHFIWRPETCNVKVAGDLIQPLQNAIKSMEEAPKRYIAFNAENGWGTYKDFLPWLKDYLQACIEYPEAKVRASR